MTAEGRLRLGCACGWEVTGTDAELERLVAATIEHGRQVHNMEATREEVLARLDVDG